MYSKKHSLHYLNSEEKYKIIQCQQVTIKMSAVSVNFRKLSINMCPQN